MKKTQVSVLFLFTVLLFSCGGSKKSSSHVAYPWKVDSTAFTFAQYVDPMIGTAGHGHTFPGATAPFGMVQLSPDTRIDGSWDGCSGYHYSDDTIYGFSHTHLSGTGCSDYGDFLLMPGKGEIQFTNGADGKPGYRSSFSHTNETATAGYYSVLLDNSKTKVELTASPRVGMHRYSFAREENEGWVLLDLQHRDEVLAAHLEIVNDHTIRGYRFSRAWATDQRLWFYAEFSKPFKKSTLWHAGKTFEADSSSEKDLKAAFTFDVSDHKPVLVKLALSPVSSENAQLNMETEVPGWDFDDVNKKVLQQWNSELGKIEVKSEDTTKKKIFYTALYHCFISPNLYCDVNGDYQGRDHKVYRDTLHPQYTVFSLWDTYRALNPLFTIVQQKRTCDFISTFIKQAQEGGTLPVWELSANETNCMIGYHSVPVIVDAWMKGITNWDTATAYEAMKSGALQGTRGLDTYRKFGFIPAEGESESVSKTLEYAYDDWCISLAAKRMKEQDDYQLFNRRSQSWQNLYDPSTGFFRARLNNSFVQPFDPNEVNFHYTEANAWQYALAVQQDIPGLIRAHGGPVEFIRFLDSLFAVSSKTSGREQADITGLIGQYAQGNEPSHHMAYLYDYTSQAWKTQELVSKICNTMYTDKPDGLCGNEDCGQMSAWYVFSAMGFYPVTPCSPEFEMGSPQFPEVILHLENGKQFTLTAKNASPANPYIVHHSENIKRNTILFSTITNGSQAEVEMAPEKDSANVVYPMQGTDDTWFPVPAVPIISNYSGRSFVKEARLELSSSNCEVFSPNAIAPGVSVYYRLDEKGWQKYTGPILINKNATLETFASKNGNNSDTAFARFFRAPDFNSITLKNPYAHQYAAGGDRALIDGIRGSDNFRTGDWQGYEGNDIDAIIDLGAVKNVSHIAIGFLQDQGAWIFMPQEVTFYASADGKNFSEIETSKNTILQEHEGPILHDFYTDKKTKARYIKVLAKNTGKCPDWHPGKGSPSWIFADEIMINAN